jgi:hypothetical protein
MEEELHLDPDATPERFEKMVVSTVGVDYVGGILVKVGDDRGRIRELQNIPNLNEAITVTKGYRGQIAEQLSKSEIARDATHKPADVWMDILNRIDAFLKEAENRRLSRSELLEHLALYPTVARAIAYVFDNGTPASHSLFDAVKYLDSLKDEQAARQEEVNLAQSMLAKEAAREKAKAEKSDLRKRRLAAVGLTSEDLREEIRENG